MNIILCIFLTIAPLSNERLTEIGAKVWQNESSGTIAGLTCWNKGEEFASLGIGHFIWIPVNRRVPFEETFPDLIRFFKSRKVEIPRWIEDARGCPWKTRDEFQRAVRLQSKQLVELKKLLQKTITLQVEFLKDRFDHKWPKLIEEMDEQKKAKLQSKLNRIMEHPNGYYALIDYVNFKGTGASKDERYAGCGWGLCQVLENMPDRTDTNVMTDFVKTAKNLLEKRVQNAPNGRNEQQFLKGWFSRLDSYER